MMRSPRPECLTRPAPVIADRDIYHRRNYLDARREINSLGIVHSVLKRNHNRVGRKVWRQQFRCAFRIHCLHREKNQLRITDRFEFGGRRNRNALLKMNAVDKKAITIDRLDMWCAAD